MQNKQIGAIWYRKSKKGTPFMSGKINEQEIIIFKNDYKKEGDNRPDYIIYPSSERTEAPQTSETPERVATPDADIQTANEALQMAGDDKQ